MTTDNQAAQDSAILSGLMEIRNDLNYYITASIPHRTDAEDVFQEVSLKIWNMRNQFEIGTNFKAWAFTVARFTILDWRKRYATRRIHVLDLETIELIAQDAEEELLADAEADQKNYTEALTTCLTKLDQKANSVLKLHYKERVTMADIAVRHASTESAIKQFLYRTRNKLRKCIEGRIARQVPTV